MKRALIIEPEGQIAGVEDFEERPPLKWLQDAVGGLIERVRLTPTLEMMGYELWAHEEALLRNEPVLNETASNIAGTSIFGTVVLVHRWEEAWEADE